MATIFTRTRGEALAVTARVVLGFWFLYSGGVKVFGTGLDRFTVAISNYKMVGEPWDAVAAYTVPWFELVVGLCLLLGILRRGAYLTLAGMVVVFACSIGWAWGHQLDISCGCHGGDGKIQYWLKVGEFVLYFTVLGWLWWWEGWGGKAVPREKLRNMA